PVVCDDPSHREWHCCVTIGVGNRGLGERLYSHGILLRANCLRRARCASDFEYYPVSAACKCSPTSFEINEFLAYVQTERAVVCPPTVELSDVAGPPPTCSYSRPACRPLVSREPRM